MEDVYDGNSFSIIRNGNRWEIYRLYDVGFDTGRESIHFSTEAMDELRDYFADCYAEDRTA